MRILRAAGLTVFIAITMACTITPAAMADKAIVLCSVNEATCKSEDYAGESFTATGASAISFAGLGSVECISTIARDEAGQIATLSFASCSQGCTVKADNLSYGAELASTGGGNGEIFIFDGGSGSPQFSLVCGSTECVYAAEPLESQFEGGEPALFTAYGGLTEQTKSFFCPKEAGWEAHYEFTAPSTAVYIVDRAVEGPVFCLINETVCPQKAISHALYAELEPKATFKVSKLVGGAIDCTESGFGLLDNIDPFAPGPWRYKPFGILGCSHPTYSSCQLTQEHLSYYGNLVPLGGGNGEVSVGAGDPKKEPALRIECSSGKTPFSCTYSTEEFWLEVEGGEPASVDEIRSMARIAGSATFCPVSVLVQADYETVSIGPGINPTLFLTES